MIVGCRTSIKTLKSLLKIAGSQFVDLSTAGIRSHFLFRVQTLAAAFWTSCSPSRYLFNVHLSSGRVFQCPPTMKSSLVLTVQLNMLWKVRSASRIPQVSHLCDAFRTVLKKFPVSFCPDEDFGLVTGKINKYKTSSYQNPCYILRVCQ